MEEALMKVLGEHAGKWVVNHVGWTVIIVLLGISIILRILNYFFKISKREIDPIGWFITKLGRALTKGVAVDIAEFRKSTDRKFEDIRASREVAIKKMQNDYNKQIADLKSDIDSFEKSTSVSLDQMKKGTDDNCKMLKKRMDTMEKSNDLQTVRQIRAHVLDFANSCMNGRKHTKLDFENIMNNENETYEALCKKYKIKNSVYKADYEYIEKCYKKCQEENSFLKEAE